MTQHCKVEAVIDYNSRGLALQVSNPVCARSSLFMNKQLSAQERIAAFKLKQAKKQVEINKILSKKKGIK